MGWSPRGVSQEMSGEAGQEEACKVRAGRNLGGHRVQGVVNMVQR